MDFLRYWLGRAWGFVYLDRVRERWTDETREMVIGAQLDIGKRVARWRDSGVSDAQIVDHVTDVFAHWPDKPWTAPWEASFGGVVREMNQNIVAHQVRPK